MLIMGAAGRDFHVFNCCYRDRADVDVVAFTAAQIPHIEDRNYPAVLAGQRYPDGIPIHPETDLADLMTKNDIDEVVFAYSDVSLDYVAARRRLVEAHGAAFSVFDADATMLPSSKPVIAVTAIRTGCGKSQTSRRITHLLKELGKDQVVIRHPMPYGKLAEQRIQRFATFEDLDNHQCTIEEREEYEPHINNGIVVYAGIDYAAILAQAEEEADIIIWDGGNNDTPFYKPDLWVVVTDPHRADHERDYFPGTVNFERADLILINKVDSADEADIRTIESNARQFNPDATVVRARSPLELSDPEAVRDKRVLAVEDGPTTTHGGMTFGAGVLAARQYGAAEIVDPRPWAVGEIAETYLQYPNTGALLPAMGYGDKQVSDLEASINATDCDLVLVATPIDLSRIMRIDKPCVRVTYRLAEEGNALVDAVKRVATFCDQAHG
jgi:predicted GTPase